MLTLTHSPADVTRWCLIALGLGADPEASNVWPIYATSEPDAPDSVLTVYDTVGQSDGRSMNGGELFTQHGIQVRVRAPTHGNSGWTKADAIRHALAVSVYDEEVAIADTASRYLVSCYSRIGEVMVLGKDAPTSKRSLFTINALVSLRQLV